MDMQDNGQNQDRSESNPSPQDLAGMMDLDLGADDPVFNRPTEYTISDNSDGDFSDQECDQGENEFQYDEDVIDVEATSPEADPFAKEFNPEKNRTLVGLQSSGFAKAAVVVGGSLAVLTGGVMVFQNQLPKAQVAQETKKKDPADEKISSAQAAAEKAQQSESEIKAQLALSKQKDSLAQANGSNNPSPTASPTAANPNQNPTAAVTVNPPATVANQNLPTAQLAAAGQPAPNNNRNVRVSTPARRSSASIAQNASTAKAPAKQPNTQVAQATAVPLAQSASRILPVVKPVVNRESVAQARATKTAPAPKVAAQSLTPVAAPGVPVAQAQPRKTTSRAAQVAKAALQEPQSDNYRFGTTASNGNNPAAAPDTRRPLTDVMRGNNNANSNNLNRDTQLAIVRSPGANTSGNNNSFGNNPATASTGGEIATNGNVPTSGFSPNRPIENNGTLATAQTVANNAPAPSLTPPLSTFLQRSNPAPAETAAIVQGNPSPVTTKPELRSPVAPVARGNSNPMDSLGSPANAQSTNLPTSVEALANVGDRLSQKLSALIPSLNVARTSPAPTTNSTIATATITPEVSTPDLGQGIQKYQRLQPVGQVASTDTVSSNNRALLSSRPAFAYSQSVVAMGGIDSRGQVATSTDLPAESDRPAPNNLTAKSILVGTSARATTVTPILWNAGANSGAKFIIKLEEPIRDNSGQVALPAGTQLVAIAKPSTVSAELADLEVVGVVVQGEEFAPPAGMLTIRNEQNGLIVGQDYFQRGNQIAGRDSMIFVTGALGTVGRVLNQPTNTFTSTGLNGTVTSSSNGQPNILGAVLEGGFRDLPATWTARNQQAIQEIASKPNVYQLPKGSSVRVFVNQTLNF